jgi:LacI family transcriptional regulator
MEKRIDNIKGLAAYLGLSIATVSRVLNGKSVQYRISSQTSKRVLDTASAFNYSPNKIARGLKLTKTETIGLIVPDIANPFFASIAKSIETESRKFGYSIILCDSHDEIVAEQELMQLLWDRKVDGVVISPVGLCAEHIIAFAEKGVPVVIIDRFFPGQTLPYITTDNYMGSFQAIEYLIGMGHKKIACIQGIQGISVNEERVRGYVDALKKYQIVVDETLILGEDFGVENGYIQTRKLIKIPEPPTAILVLSNLSSLGVMQALAEAGLKIPLDISLVAFDEQPYSAFLATPMTTIDQPKDEIGRLSVEILLKKIGQNITHTDTQSDDHITLKPRLIIRESVRKIVEQLKV